ncbi:hypothetical protein Tco_0593164 [Tanacetum coccineum]
MTALGDMVSQYMQKKEEESELRNEQALKTILENSHCATIVCIASLVTIIPLVKLSKNISETIIDSNNDLLIDDEILMRTSLMSKHPHPDAVNVQLKVVEIVNPKFEGL